MKRKIKKPKVELDREEEELLSSFELDEWQSVKDVKKELDISQKINRLFIYY